MLFNLYFSRKNWLYRAQSIYLASDLTVSCWSSLLHIYTYIHCLYCMPYICPITPCYNFWKLCCLATTSPLYNTLTPILIWPLFNQVSQLRKYSGHLMHQWLFMYFLTCVITTYVPIHLFITAFINLPSFIMIIFVRVCTWLGAVWPGSGLYAGLPGDREGAGGGARGADAAGATPLQQPLHIIQLRPYTPRGNRL